jgi:SHS2 domain-containing protein
MGASGEGAYEILDHTADVRVVCKGTDLPGVMAAARDALYAVALESVPSGAPTEARRIEIGGASDADLVVRWVQELNYLLDVEQFVARDLSFRQLPRDPDETVPGWRIDARGCRCRPEDRATEIKAATYHGAELRRDTGRLSIELVFDL